MHEQTLFEITFWFTVYVIGMIILTIYTIIDGQDDAWSKQRVLRTFIRVLFWPIRLPMLALKWVLLGVYTWWSELPDLDSDINK